MDRETAEPSVESIPGERAERWVAYHQARAAPSTFVYEFVWDATAPAIGPFCTDVDGNVLLDFASHVAASPLGYNNPKILDPLAEFELLDPSKTAGQDFYTAHGWPPEAPDVPGPTQLLDRLVDLTDHYGMDTVFLSNSGAEAVENAIKICYDHRGGAHGITFEGGFHGRTLGALSLNRSKAIHRQGFPEIPGIQSVPFCEDRRCEPSTCRCGFFRDAPANGDAPGGAEGGEEDVTSALGHLLGPHGSLAPEDVSYVVIEPVQGEGGYRFPSREFVREIADVVARYDVPLVADEIQTGLGRTGEMWGVDHTPIEPDVITAGKALRVGATIGRAELFPDGPGRLSTTWGGGDLLASAQGALTIDAIREYDLLANARRRGSQFKDRLREEAPEFVTDVRGWGLLLAVEFDSKARRNAAVRAAFRRGLLTLGCGYRTMRILPPLDVTSREIALGARVLLDALTDHRVRRATPNVSGADDVV